jgi:eukaryotic-like serine/threonine-protein kinase
VPPDLAALVHESLAKDPSKRPASARAFLARVKDVRAGLRAPQLRAVRNVPGLDSVPAMAPTVPMAVYDVPGPSRAAVLPAAELRASDVPVEGVARPSRITPRRASAAAFGLVGGATLAAAGWLFVASLGSPPAETPRPAASAPPPAPPPVAATPTPTASASAIAPPKATPARTPSRRPPAPAPRARNRLFGTDP